MDDSTRTELDSDNYTDDASEASEDTGAGAPLFPYAPSVPDSPSSDAPADPEALALIEWLRSANEAPVRDPFSTPKKPLSSPNAHSTSEPPSASEPVEESVDDTPQSTRQERLEQARARRRAQDQALRDELDRLIWEKRAAKEAQAAGEADEVVEVDGDDWKTAIELSHKKKVGTREIKVEGEEEAREVAALVRKEELAAKEIGKKEKSTKETKIEEKKAKAEQKKKQKEEKKESKTGKVIKAGTPSPAKKKARTVHGEAGYYEELLRQQEGLFAQHEKP